MKSQYSIIKFRLIALLSFLCVMCLTLVAVSFEIISVNTDLRYSIENIMKGGLVNINEHQLLIDGFSRQDQNIRRRNIVYYHKDTLKTQHQLVPVVYSVIFESQLESYPDFYQPLRFEMAFDPQYDSLVFIELSLLMPAGDTVKKEKSWLYRLDHKVYFFIYVFDTEHWQTRIETEIFSGKLFLMHKFLVCRIYNVLPRLLQPEWYQGLH